jgi:hypothetical protein
MVNVLLPDKWVTAMETGLNGINWLNCYYQMNTSPVQFPE